MKNLEVAYTEKDNEIHVMTQEHKIELKEYEKERDNTNKSLQESVGGYNITLSNSSKSRKFNNPKHFGTFNGENDDLSVENFKLTKIIYDLVQVTSKVLSQYKDQRNTIEWHENVLNRIDKEVGKIMVEQKGMKEEEAVLQRLIDEINIDFEDHWKLIQQVIRDNKDIGVQVTRLQKIEIPSIRNFIITKSNGTKNPLGHSNALTNNLEISTLLNNQLQTSKMTEQNLEITGNTGNFWDGSNSSLNQPLENIKGSSFQESVYLKGDGSLCSNDFNLVHPDNESDLGIVIKNSILENMGDVESEEGESSGVMSNLKGSFEKDGKVSQG